MDRRRKRTRRAIKSLIPNEAGVSPRPAVRHTRVLPRASVRSLRRRRANPHRCFATEVIAFFDTALRVPFLDPRIFGSDLNLLDSNRAEEVEKQSPKPRH